MGGLGLPAMRQQLTKWLPIWLSVCNCCCVIVGGQPGHN